MAPPRLISSTASRVFRLHARKSHRKSRERALERLFAPTPPHPAHASGFSSLPVELKAQIIEMATADGRWEDMTTLQAVMQVNRACYDLAAPKFWTTVNLYFKPDNGLQRVGFVLSARTRSFVTTVLTSPAESEYLAGDYHARLQPLYVQIISQFPNVHDLGFELFVGAGEDGVAMLTQLARSIYSRLTSVAVKTNIPSLHHQVLGWDRLQILLGALDNKRLTRLTLGSIGGFARSAPPLNLLHTLQQDRQLTHLYLDTRFCGGWTLHLFSALDAPLRSLHLELDERCDIDCTLLPSFLNRFTDTLEYLYLAGHKKGEVSDEIDLPKLRHLCLHRANSLDLLPAFSSSPLEILDISSGGALSFLFGASTGDIAHLVPALIRHARTLEVVLLDSAMSEALQDAHGLQIYVQIPQQLGIRLVWKGESPPFRWWCDLEDGLDDYQRSCKVEGGGPGVLCA
ncbi:hypothetical protein JCM10449v2_006574 [Rhodotorula kratochvilovae]